MPCPDGKWGPGTCSQKGCWPYPAFPFGPIDCKDRPAGDVQSCCKSTGSGNEWDDAAKQQCQNEGGTWEDTGNIACATISSRCVDPRGREACWGGSSWEDWVTVFPLAFVQIEKDMDCWEQECWYNKCKIFRCKPCTCPNCPPGKCPSTAGIGGSFLS